MDKIQELPHGAADTAPIPVAGPQSLIIECLGKNISKCLYNDFYQISYI